MEVTTSTYCLTEPTRSRTYQTYKEAAGVATSICWRAKVTCTLKRLDNAFLLQAPISVDSMDVAQLFEYSTFELVDMPVLQFINHERFQDPSLTWLDVKSGLTWDAGRLFFTQSSTEIPNFKLSALNLVGYGGFSDWRAPTILELQTLLTKDGKLTSELASFVPGHCLWSCEPSIDDGVFFDYEKGRRIEQYFREQNRNRSCRGDGYLYSAVSVAVRG